MGFFGLSGVLGGTAGGFDSEGAGGTEAVVDVEGLGVVEVDGEGVGVVVESVVEVVGDGVVTLVYGQASASAWSRSSPLRCNPFQD